MRLELGKHYISYSTDGGVLVVPHGWRIPCLFPIRRWGIVGKGYFIGVMTRAGDPVYPRSKAEAVGEEAS